MNRTGKYAYGFHDDDTFYGHYDTIEDAYEGGIEDALVENEGLDEEEKIKRVYVGKVMEFVPIVDADSVLEELSSKAYEEVGECAYNYLEDVSREQKELLEQMLTEAFNKWAKETKNEPRFYTVEDTEWRSI